MDLFQRVRRSLMGAPVILFFVGLIFFGVGGGLTYYQVIFRQDAIQTEGQVISLSESCDDDGCHYSPNVRFTTRQGETVFYHSKFGSYPPEYEVGETVPIFYKAENPEKAIISGEGGILRFIFMGVGGAIILGGMAFFAVNLKNTFLAEE